MENEKPPKRLGSPFSQPKYKKPQPSPTTPKKGAKEPKFVFVAQELWLPEDPAEVKGAGSRTLGVFNNLNEANAFAEGHVKALERETQRPMRTEDEAPLEEDEDSKIDREVEIFRGSYEKTKKEKRNDGGFEWTVYWGDKTVVFVEKQQIHTMREEGEMYVPLHDPTFCMVSLSARVSDARSSLISRCATKPAAREREQRTKADGLAAGRRSMSRLHLESLRRKAAVETTERGMDAEAVGRETQRLEGNESAPWNKQVLSRMFVTLAPALDTKH